uniref:BZIP domain-containing protein n=1 Tax=Kalanchoe fedtschenkoi TaxID=63787 RepID=A0A7N0TET7_KALFE
MGSYMNYKNFGEASQVDGGGVKPDFPIARQSSILGLTFDELQSTFSGLGKDFGSMNMDELLKSIWSAEETQNVTLMAGGAGEGSSAANGGLQKQGSLTLPRTISQKKVDDVWRDLFVENAAQRDGISESVRSLERRQQTLGEITLEEFLFRAGVVREDEPKPSEKMSSSNGFYGGDLARLNNDVNNGITLNFQQPGQATGVPPGNRIADNMSTGFATNLASVRPSQHVRVKQQAHLPIFPKQTNLSFASPARHLVGDDPHMGSPVARIGAANPPNSNGMDLSGVMGLRGGNVKVPISPAPVKNADMIAQSNMDSSPLSSSPYAYTGMRGRKRTATLEKAIERRNRRMIKNRESAARSRARKQAYTTELEEEIARLKEANEDMQRKQAEIIEMQKNQMVEKMRQQWGGKRIYLKRTLTGPW